MSAEDFLSRESARTSPYVSKGCVQMFVLSYLCQSCKSVPEVFVIRRQGSRLTLSGRAPIEHVEVPTEIGKEVCQFYRGAMLAHQSGQTLPGLFMLRTVIEQWARRITKSTGKADEVLDAYVATLPEDFRERFPVLRDTYSELSADLHSATGSDELFEGARRQIVRHFEARALFATERVEISTGG